MKKKNKDRKSFIFIGEFGSGINQKIICVFDNYDIGLWVMELLHNKMHFITRSYFGDKYIECITVPYKGYGQTLFKFCFDNIKTIEELEYEIKYKCKYNYNYNIEEDLFCDKIKKIIMLNRNKKTGFCK